MTIFELIGFLIVILALLAPLIRRVLEKRAERKNPEEYARRRAEAEEREKEALRQLLTRMGQEIPPELREEEPPPQVVVVPRQPEPPPPPVMKPVPVLDKEYEFYHDRPSTIQKLIERSSGREMVLLREILEPPVSLR